MKSKSKTILIVSFLSVLLFSATVYAQSKPLIGEWALLSFAENGNNIPLVITEKGRNIPLVGNRPIEQNLSVYLMLTKDSFSVRPACNSKSGKFAIMKSGKLKFTTKLTTVMGCTKEREEMDQRFVAALSKISKYKIKDRILTLQDAGGQNVLTFKRSSLRNQSPE